MFATRCFIVSMAICAFATPAFSDGKLWLGSSIADAVLETDTGGKEAAIVAQSGISGIAFDGANLYFEDGKGNITKRTADGISVLDTFQAAVPGKAAEDMAWDSKRQRLLRITRDNLLARIDPVSHRIEKNLTLPNTSPKGLPGLLGEGLAYDAARDLIYVGFVSQASGGGGYASALSVSGAVVSFDAETFTAVGELFQTDYEIFGLAYDPLSDTLWSGGGANAQNLALTGQVLSSFPHDALHAPADGLEFITSSLIQGCRISPSNYFLPFHWDQHHIKDPVHHPLHRFTISVASEGRPASGVAVKVTATKPVFPVGLGQPPTLAATNVTTDATGQAVFGINPPMAAAFDRTEFVATGTVGGQPFTCQSSAVVGIGALSGALQRYLADEVVQVRAEPFKQNLLALRQILMDRPDETARLRKMKKYRSPIRKIVNWRPERLTDADLRGIQDLVARFQDAADPSSRKTLVLLNKQLPEIQELAKVSGQAGKTSLPQGAGWLRHSSKDGSSAARLSALVNYGRLPLTFEPNVGQADRNVRYLARSRDYQLYLTPREAVLVRVAPSPLGNSYSSVTMRVQDANPSPRLQALEEMPGKSHYLLGDDPRGWRTNVPHYAKVKYERIYDGVDLVFHGQPQQLEFDFIVAPGTSPAKISLGFRGVDRIDTDVTGNLILNNGASSLRLAPPVVYQETDGLRQYAAGHYVLRGANHVGFEIAGYDAAKPLIIDPVLSYASYLGGANDELAAAVAVDPQGNAYVTGSTSSANFPVGHSLSPGSDVSPHNWDVFVTKLNPSGSALIYSTYVGGSEEEGGFGIAADSGGNAYVTGMTMSADFPTVLPIQKAFKGNSTDKEFPTDAFIFKLNADGSAMIYSTYLGGSGGDIGKGIAVDTAGNAYVAGLTGSIDFPIRNALQQQMHGPQDTFITKVNAAGTDLVYSTYLGGSRSERATSIAVDSAFNAYVTGITYSPDFPTQNPVQPVHGGAADAFVAKINSAGTGLVYSTFLGGEGDDFGLGIAVDGPGNAYITGATGSASFPLANPLQPKFGASSLLGADAFVTKVTLDGSALVYSTYLGGAEVDAGMSIAVGPDGSAYIAGETGSADFPTAGAIQPATSGLNEAFLARLNPAGTALLYSTFLGGSGQDGAAGMALDPSGSVYIVGSSTSADFPVTGSAYQPGNVGLTDALVMKLVEGTPPPKVATISAASFLKGAPVAAESIVSAFGQNLTSLTEEAKSLPLPPILAGISVQVKDSSGDARLAPLFFASAGQINYQVPKGTSVGLASISILSGGQSVATGTLRVQAVAPGLFSANANGQGVAAAVVQKLAADKSQTSAFVFTCGSIAGSCVPAPIDLGAATDRVYLVLFGTGIRGRSSLAAVSASVGGIPVPVVFAGDSGQFVGLDQVNIGPLPRSLKGTGQANVILTVDGNPANTVTVAF